MVRPRVLLAVCGSLAVVCTLGLGVLMWQAPGVPDGYSTRDTIAWIILGTLIIGLLLRVMRIALIITDTGIIIRNYGRTTIYGWSAIIRVNYTTDSDWVAVETTDGRRTLIQALATSEGKQTRQVHAELVQRVNSKGGEPT